MDSVLVHEHTSFFNQFPISLTRTHTHTHTHTHARTHVRTHTHTHTSTHTRKKGKKVGIVAPKKLLTCLRSSLTIEDQLLKNLTLLRNCIEQSSFAYNQLIIIVMITGSSLHSSEIMQMSNASNTLNPTRRETQH
jgi:hypothetical protein